MLTVETISLERSKRIVILFVKSPVPGEVKTKLIPFLTGLEAADLYKCFVSDIIKNVSRLPCVTKVQIAYQPHSKANDISWLGTKNPPELFKQEGRSLGERLIHSFGLAFGRGAKQVVVIGSDAPTLPKEYIEQAFTALNHTDVVLGPAYDGGYYLIGLSRPCLKLFDDVSWSCDQVFERTALNAQRNGYSLKILPKHYDVNTIDELNFLNQTLLNDGHDAPTTKRFLHNLLQSKRAMAVT
jgi:uncharacterized protein